MSENYCDYYTHIEEEFWISGEESRVFKLDICIRKINSGYSIEIEELPFISFSNLEEKKYMSPRKITHEIFGKEALKEFLIKYYNELAGYVNYEDDKVPEVFAPLYNFIIQVFESESIPYSPDEITPNWEKLVKSFKKGKETEHKVITGVQTITLKYSKLGLWQAIIYNGVNYETLNIDSWKLYPEVSNSIKTFEGYKSGIFFIEFYPDSGIYAEVYENKLHIKRYGV